MKLDVIFNKSSEAMNELPDKSVNLMVTSPPYNIGIDYGYKYHNGRAVESKGVKYSDSLSEDKYRIMLKNVIDETKRVLKDEGQIWFNIKSRYDGKQIIPPFWVMELFEDMFLKNLIVWNFDWGGSTNKRFAPRYEFVFFYTKHKDKYTFNLDEVKIPSLNFRPDRYKTQLKNPSDVWRMALVSGNEIERTDHPAQYPEELIERIILTGTNEGEIVLDPFMGSGTTAVVAKKLNRHFIGYEIVKEYIEMATERIENRCNNKIINLFGHEA
jgi:DNA modification methylase